jgi:tRNA threonylcarbamoyladenosine modification (KEOPS) complex  Pcc1 subunit
VEDLTKKAAAIVCLRLPSEIETKIIQKAIKPETESSSTHRSKVKIIQKGRNITLTFEAKDTAALRASTNSYLSWLQLLTNIYDVLESKRS